MSPQQRDKLQHSLLAALRANGGLRCPRPVLRGTGEKGSSEGDLRALMEPTGGTARCLAQVERHWAALRLALFREPDKLPGGAAGRSLPEAVPLSVGMDPALTRQLHKRCGALPAKVERAVQWAGACSPYVPGRRRSPRLGPVLQLHLAMVVLARQRFRTSPRQAIWMLLHTLRLGQDLCRGGTAWIWPLVTRLGALDVVATLGRMLAADRLSGAALEEVRTGLERLAASEPALMSFLRGERLSAELERYLIPMMPSQWIPPGGRPRSASGGASARGDRRARSVSGSVRQDLLVAWIASRRFARRLAAGCRDAASDSHCLQAVRAVERDVVSRRAQLTEQWKAFSRRLASSPEQFDRAATREAAVALLTGLDAPDTSGYLLQAAQRGFYLAALRLHVDVLRAAHQGGWPKLATVAAWPRARRDPFFRLPLQLRSRGTGFEVRPARSLKATPAGAPVRYVISGPVPSPAAPGRTARGATGAPAVPRPRTR